MNRLHLALIFFLVGSLGCSPYRERVLPSLQAKLEAQYGAPLALTQEVKAAIEAWTNEPALAIVYDREGALHVISASEGDQAFMAGVEAAVVASGKPGSFDPMSALWGLLGAGIVGLGGWSAIRLGRALRKEEVAAEVAAATPAPVLPPGAIVTSTVTTTKKGAKS